MTYEAVQQAVTVIRSYLPEDFRPKLGIILGSGLGDLGENIDQLACISYKDIPGFHISSVPGHAGQLVAGYLQGLPVLCLQGRVHFYEGTPVDSMRVMVRALQHAGCETLLLTNAAGSLNADVPPGRLMLIKDHINFQAINPLVGPNDERIGPRFIAMNKVYDEDLRKKFHEIAATMDLKLEEGVYFGVLGPTFETPAEIRAFRILGADAIGMSTVPEVILAHHCGMKVVCISVITNYGSGMVDEVLTHEQHVVMTKMMSGTLVKLVQGFAEDMAGHE
jgi:xanthosine phosphorylase